MKLNSQRVASDQRRHRVGQSPYVAGRAVTCTAQKRDRNQESPEYARQYKNSKLQTKKVPDQESCEQSPEESTMEATDVASEQDLQHK